jgi:hypothetical protein
MAAADTELSPILWSKDVVKAMFNRRAAANIDRYFDMIDSAIDDQLGALPALIPPGPAGDAARAQVKQRLQLKLYAFATISVENAQMQCKDEEISKFNTLGIAQHIYVYRPFGIYDFDSKSKKGRHIGNHGVGMGERYKGRGFFQLTGMYNYRKYGRLIGMGDELVHRPDLASRPEIAARILAAYLLEHKARVIAALDRGDFKKARQAVNSKALGWEDMQDAYQTGESILTVPVAKPSPTPVPSPPAIAPQLRPT